MSDPLKTQEPSPAHTIADVDDDHDPSETIVDSGPGALETLPAIEDAMLRLQAVLDVEKADFDPATLHPGATIDDVIGALYDRAVIDKRQFISAHAVTELEVSEALEDIDRRYHNLGFFDEGGVGEIFVAKDLTLKRKVAVKRIKPHVRTSDQTRQRFLREAQITAQLDHPNIVPIYSFDTPDASEPSSYAMKLIRGSTLAARIEEQKERIAQGQPDTKEHLAARIELFLKVCDAIAYAHSRRVIHRDLKPENIMVGSFGEVYVMDWGIARLLRSESDAKRLSAAGTPFYMSPEQASGRPEAIDPRSDIYALGLILFELCTLQRAIPGDGLIDVITHAIDGVRRPFEHSGEMVISPDLEAIVEAACAFNPESRYDSVADFADDLRHYLHGEEVSVRPDNTTRRVLRWIVHHRELTLLTVLLLLLALGGAIIWSLYRQQAMAEAAAQREDRIMAWQGQVAWHASDLERRLLRIEMLTLQLGRTTSTLLAYPPAEAGPVFDHDAIEAGAASPPGDFRDAPSHMMKASFAEPIFDLPPGVSLDATRADIHKLYPLKRTFQRIFLDYRERFARSLDDEVLQSMRDELVPLRWSYIALENGLYIGYPGTTGLPETYDSRKRPWYETATRGGGAVVWGTPYYGVQAGMLGMPALLALFNDDGSTLGVVAVEVQVERLVQSMLKRTEAGDVSLSLLDDQGRVVTTSGPGQAATRDTERTDALELAPYPHAEVLEALQERHSGYIEIDVDGTSRFIGFQSLPTLGWYYVEEIEADRLLK